MRDWDYRRGKVRNESCGSYLGLSRMLPSNSSDEAALSDRRDSREGQDTSID